MLTAPYFITKDNAKELAAKGNQVRWGNRKMFASAMVATQPEVANDDPIAQGITRAIERTLVDLDKSKLAKERAMLAQALRNLRETYHLVTGQPRPGQIKSVAPRTRTQSYPSPEVIPEPIAIEAQVSSVPMARPNAGCGPVQAPVPVQPSPTVAVNAPALPEPGQGQP